MWIERLYTLKALDAYDNGAQPLSLWKKRDILQLIDDLVIKPGLTELCLEDFQKLTLYRLRELCLVEYCQAGTGMYQALTTFYIFDPEKVSRLKKEDLPSPRHYSVIRPTDGPARCSYLVWSAPYPNGTPERVEEDGIIRGDWFFSESGVRKKITRKGFRVIKKYDHQEAKEK